MLLLSLPDECSIDILSFLDDKSLYKCLFVNRYYCKLTVPIIWRNPFRSTYRKPKISLIISTLLSCLNEDEISLLAPYAINFVRNNQPPLFEYGKFVRNIDHECCVENIIDWLGRIPINVIDCCVQGLVNVIYHVIMRQGSNLQEFGLELSQESFYIDLPKQSTFMIHKPGITNLRSLTVEIDFGSNYDVECQNAIEFLSMVSTFCNGIVDCDLWILELTSEFFKPLLDIIKSQTLERMIIHISSCIEKENFKNILYALEFRSVTLKELSFNYLNFQDIDLSFVLKLERLESLEFVDCYGFTSNHFETLPKKKLHLKELKLLDIESDIMEAMINLLCSNTLLLLFTNIITLEMIRAVKKSCSNIRYLHIKISSEQFLDSIIPIICDLSSLKILKIEIGFAGKGAGLLVKILGDHLTYVEYLSLNFHIDLLSFKYFTNNCKANLKKWNIIVTKYLRKDYLTCVNNFQKVHNSLKVLRIKGHEDGFCWTNDELEVICSLKNQGVNILSSE